MPNYIRFEKRHYLEKLLVSKAAEFCRDCFSTHRISRAFGNCRYAIPFPDSTENKCEKEIRIIRTFDEPIDVQPKSPNIQAKFKLAYSGLLYIRKVNGLSNARLCYRL